ncbi:MAG: hypothetical protein Q8936_21245 [Bacillota bacterium]|nr:hypothetical protein [Bacillota bacterium]
MEGIYVGYICRGCGKETILITEEADRTLTEGKYIACAHCGCKKIVKENTTNDLRETMKSRSYKRVNGRLRETK